MKYASLIGVGLAASLLAGCAKVPEQTAQPAPQEVAHQEETDPNIPDEYTIVKICGDGTKIYLLNGVTLPGDMLYGAGESGS